MIRKFACHLLINYVFILWPLEKNSRNYVCFKQGFVMMQLFCSFLYIEFICAGSRWNLWRIGFSWWKTKPWYYSDASDAQWPDSILQYNSSPSYVFILQVNKTWRQHFWRKCWGWICVVVLHSPSISFFI